MRVWQSGQMHLTVTQTGKPYGGSNPSARTLSPTLIKEETNL
jgi:hypothetical protein